MGSWLMGDALFLLVLAGAIAVGLWLAWLLLGERVAWWLRRRAPVVSDVVPAPWGIAPRKDPVKRMGTPVPEAVTAMDRFARELLVGSTPETGQLQFPGSFSGERFRVGPGPAPASVDRLLDTDREMVRRHMGLALRVRASLTMHSLWELKRTSVTPAFVGEADADQGVQLPLSEVSPSTISFAWAVRDVWDMLTRGRHRGQGESSLLLNEAALVCAEDGQTTPMDLLSRQLLLRRLVAQYQSAADLRDEVVKASHRGHLNAGAQKAVRHLRESACLCLAVARRVGPVRQVRHHAPPGSRWIEVLSGLVDRAQGRQRVPMAWGLPADLRIVTDRGARTLEALTEEVRRGSRPPQDYIPPPLGPSWEDMDKLLKRLFLLSPLSLAERIRDRSFLPDEEEWGGAVGLAGLTWTGPRRRTPHAAWVGPDFGPWQDSIAQRLADAAMGTDERAKLALRRLTRFLEAAVRASQGLPDDERRLGGLAFVVRCLLHLCEASTHLPVPKDTEPPRKAEARLTVHLSTASSAALRCLDEVLRNVKEAYEGLPPDGTSAAANVFRALHDEYRRTEWEATLRQATTTAAETVRKREEEEAQVAAPAFDYDSLRHLLGNEPLL